MISEMVQQYPSTIVELHDDTGKTVAKGLRESLKDKITKGYVKQDTVKPEAPYTHLLVVHDHDRPFEVDLPTFLSYSK